MNEQILVHRRTSIVGFRTRDLPGFENLEGLHTRQNKCADVLGATEQQLALAQAKITYLGEQLKPIPTLIFFTEGSAISLDEFLNVQLSSEHYDNDELPYTRKFIVTPAEVQRMLAAVKPIVTAADAAQGAEFISFSVVRKINEEATEGHEFRVGQATGRAFFQKLIDALGTENQRGHELLSTQFMNIYPHE